MKYFSIKLIENYFSKLKKKLDFDNNQKTFLEIGGTKLLFILKKN